LIREMYFEVYNIILGIFSQYGAANARKQQCCASSEEHN